MSGLARVATPRREANAVGEEVFAAGGNAVDAVVAASFAQGVAEPYMGGVGAVGEIVVREPDGAVHVIDAAARAPLAATPELYELGDGMSDVYPWPRVAGDANLRGGRSVAAPRIVAGLGAAHARFGRLEWDLVVRPAARLAEAGTELDFFSAAVIAAEAGTFAKDRLAAELYYREDGSPLPAPLEAPPEWIRNERLAATLELIATAGPEALRRGPLAEAIVAATASDGGILAAADLADAEATVIEGVAPLVDFRGWSVYGSLRPSGAVTAAQILGLLNQAAPAVDPLSPERLVGFARASHLAFADRLATLSGSDEDALALLDPEALARRAGEEPPPVPAGAAGSKVPTATTHAVAVDGDGRVAVVTQTLLALFGAQVGVHDHGFFLNDAMLWFDPRPGTPNSIAPGARALSAVAPLIAVAPGGDKVIGAAGLGARRIPGAVAQVVANLIDHGMDADAAVNAPRVHADTTATVLDQRLGANVFEAFAAADLAPTTGAYGPTTLTSARAGAIVLDRAAETASVGIDMRARAVWDFGTKGE
jgi:gamma-glutamyltranspeptidase/glutathione hydrolase